MRRGAQALVALIGVVGLFLQLGLGASAAAGVTAPGASAVQDESPVTLVLYWGEGCPRCAAEKEFLASFGADHPGLRVEAYEVYRDPATRRRFVEHLDDLGVEAAAVPTTVVDEHVWVGFSPAIEESLRSALEQALAGRPVPPGVYGAATAGSCGTDACALDPEASVDVPGLGRVDLRDRPLVLSTLLIGFVDGINPCSLWVISILLAIVVRTGSRRRVAAVGSTFLFITAGMYALYMAGVYGALSVIGHLGAIQAVVALVAGVFGVVSVKDYFRYREGISFTIPDRAKPGLYARMRRVAGERALVPALLATGVLAVGVSLLETPCTAGFPVIWTGLLEAHGVSTVQAALLFVLYMVPFLVDELLVFGIAVVTMRAAKVQERHGRVLKLVAGVTMLALAGTMTVAPELMESVTGAGLVFLGAGALAALVHLVLGRRIGARPGPSDDRELERAR